jgi:hypothetical protein
MSAAVHIVAKVERVEFRRVTDDNPDLSHLTDPERYSDVPSAEAERYREADSDRLRDFQQGAWEFLGVQAVAKVRLFLSSHPGGHVQKMEVCSGGLWGIESDSDAAYFAEVEAEQRADLEDNLAALGLRIDGEGTDAQALDSLAEFVNRPGPVNGADFLDHAEEVLKGSGREILDNADACECEDGRDAPLPGVLHPIASNSDHSRRWIERCDLCERFESDEDAAKALVEAGLIPAYCMAAPAGVVSPTPYATDADGKALPWEQS